MIKHIRSFAQLSVLYRELFVYEFNFLDRNIFYIALLYNLEQFLINLSK